VQADSEKSGIVRATVKVSLITMVSRVMGLLRDIALVYFFAPVAWALDSFYFAFTIPNLFRRLLGEGALSSAFIPEFARAREENEDTVRFASSVVTLLFLFTIGVTIAGSLVCFGVLEAFDFTEKTRLTLTLLGIMLPFAALVCTGAIMGAVSQSLRHFSIPAALSILLNLCILGALGIIAWQHWPVEADMTVLEKLRAVPLQIPAATLAELTSYAAIGVLISGALQIIVLWPALSLYGLTILPVFDFTNPRIKTVLKHMGPTAIGLGIVQINVLIDNVISYWLSVHQVGGTAPFEGATTYLFLGNRLMQLPLGIFAIAVATTAFPALSTLAAKKDFPKLGETFFSSMKMQLFILMPAAGGLIMLSKPIVQLLYQGQDMEFGAAAVYRTCAVLALLAAGLPFYGMLQVITRAFYAVGDYVTPVKVAAVMAGLNFVLNLLCIHLPDLYRHWSGTAISGLPGQMAWGQGTIINDPQGLALGEAGLALSTALCAIISVVVLLGKLENKLTGKSFAAKEWKEKLDNFAKFFCGALASGVLLGVMVHYVCGSMPYGPELEFRLERVVVTIAVSLFFYPVICSICLGKEYEHFYNMFRWRKKNAKTENSKN